jgi:hypothetical protein
MTDASWSGGGATKPKEVAHESEYIVIVEFPHRHRLVRSAVEEVLNDPPHSRTDRYHSDVIQIPMIV